MAFTNLKRRNSYSLFRSMQQKQPHLTPEADRICLCTTFYPWGSPKGSSHHKRMPPECCDLIENWIISELLTRKHTCSHVCRHTHTQTFCFSILNLVIPTSPSNLMPLIQGPPLLIAPFPLSPLQADSHKFFLEMAKVRYHLYEAGMI